MNTYIARPTFEDSRLHDYVNWIEDNALLLAQFGQALGLDMSTDERAREFGRFISQQWQHEIRYYDPNKPECSICHRHHGSEVVHEHE